MVETVIDTESKILEAAKIEFAEKGYDGARTSEIAKRADVNKAMIHYYFESKEKLYEEVLKRVLDFEKRFKIFDILDDYDLTPTQKLYLVVTITFKTYMDVSDGAFSKLVNRELAEARPQFKSLLNDFFAPRMVRLHKIVEDGIAAGEFKHKEPLLFVYNLVSAFTSFTMHRELFANSIIGDEIYGKAGLDRVMNHYLDAVFTALAPDNRQIEITKMPEKVELEVAKFLDNLT